MERMDRMIKLIATDVDGTLVEEGSPNLNPEFYDVILKLKERGILFAAASGRQYASIYRLFEPVADQMIFIAENGGYVVCRGRQIECKALDRSDFEEVVHFIRRQKDCFILVNDPDQAYTESRDTEFIQWLLGGYKAQLQQVEDVTALNTPIVKTALYCKGDAAAMAAAMKERFGDRVNIMASGQHWVDVVRADVDKGAALARIQQLMGIKKEETMAFGDNNNDIGMLLCAGESYAVANAREEAKRAARHITDRNVEDGVLKVLRTLL